MPNNPYRYASTPIRLAAWRKYAAENTARYLERGAPAPAEYAPGTLPPNWFGRVSEDSVNREPYESDGRTPRTSTYNYGDGLGGKTSRPFRFVGFADEVVRLRHDGWFGDDEGSGFSVLRGVVYQIPARGGNTQYLAGVEWGEHGARRKFETGGGWIEIGRGDIYESKEDAAHAADSLAERAAEFEREERAREDERIREEEEEEEAENEAERLALADIPSNGAD